MIRVQVHHACPRFHTDSTVHACPRFRWPPHSMTQPSRACPIHACPRLLFRRSNAPLPRIPNHLVELGLLTDRQSILQDPLGK